MAKLPLNCPSCGQNNVRAAKGTDVDAHQCMSCGSQFDSNRKPLTMVARHAMPYDAFESKTKKASAKTAAVKGK